MYIGSAKCTSKCSRKRKEPYEEGEEGSRGESFQLRNHKDMQIRETSFNIRDETMADLKSGFTRKKIQ